MARVTHRTVVLLAFVVRIHPPMVKVRGGARDPPEPRVPPASRACALGGRKVVPEILPFSFGMLPDYLRAVAFRHSGF